jgi:uncharacterized protein YgbK (DUF1537 family)
MLRSARGREEVEECLRLGARRGLSARELHLRVAESVGRIAGEIARRGEVGVLAVLGGDTLTGLVRALDYPDLLPLRELLPGIPLSELADGRRTLLASKAGGFGPEDVLTRIQEALR